jgi:hypothetical protein
MSDATNPFKGAETPAEENAEAKAVGGPDAAAGDYEHIDEFIKGLSPDELDYLRGELEEMDSGAEAPEPGSDEEYDALTMPARPVNASKPSANTMR